MSPPRHSRDSRLPKLNLVPWITEISYLRFYSRSVAEKRKRARADSIIKIGEKGGWGRDEIGGQDGREESMRRGRRRKSSLRIPSASVPLTGCCLRSRKERTSVFKVRAEKVVEGHRGGRKDGTVSRQSSGQGTRVKYIGVRGNYSPTWDLPLAISHENTLPYAWLVYQRETSLEEIELVPSRLIR